LEPLEVGAYSHGATGTDDARRRAIVNLDPIARRVVRRFRRTVLGTVRVEYSDAGRIDAVAVKCLLKPTLGCLLRLTFRPGGTPRTVLFDGVTLDDRQVQGRVVLHAAVRADTIVSWGEVFLDSVDGA
jgi:hypothetical protein